MTHPGKFVSSVPEYRRTSRGNFRLSQGYAVYTVGKNLLSIEEKWNGNLTVIEILTSTEKKSDGRSTSEQRLYISSLDSSAEWLSQITKQHWAIENIHWDLDRNLRQDSIKRKAERAARNLDTIQRMMLTLIAVWKNKKEKNIR